MHRLLALCCLRGWIPHVVLLLRHTISRLEKSNLGGCRKDESGGPSSWSLGFRCSSGKACVCLQCRMGRWGSPVASLCPRLSVYPARISFLLFRTSEEFSVLYMFLYISYPPYLAFSYVSWHSSCNQKLLPTPRYCLMYVYYMSKGNVRLSQSSCSSDHNVFYRLEQHFCIYLHHKLWWGYNGQNLL